MPDCCRRTLNEQAVRCARRERKYETNSFETDQKEVLIALRLPRLLARAAQTMFFALSASGRDAPTSCRAAGAGALHRNDTEPRLKFAIHGLFHEGMVPDGVIIDAGANDGFETCQLADLAKDRVVHAVEPIAANMRNIQRFYKPGRPNIQLWLGVLGSKPGLLRLDASTFGGKHSQVDLSRNSKAGRGRIANVQVYSIDQLLTRSFQRSKWFPNAKHETEPRLAFAHLDVEGGELDVLTGAKQALQRNRPAFTIEVHVHADQSFTRALLRYVKDLRYSCAAADEICGAFADCRNLVCLPEGPRVASFFAKHWLQPVTADTIFSLASYCQDGSACCPHGRQDTQALDPAEPIASRKWKRCCHSRGCFALLSAGECAIAGALATTYENAQCGSQRGTLGAPRLRRQKGPARHDR